MAPRAPSAAPNRETWHLLSEEYGAAASLGQAVRDTIDVIEDHSRCHLLSRVRALCQVTPPPAPHRPGRGLFCFWEGGPAVSPRPLSSPTEPSLGWGTAKFQ